jgi:cyclophilin family peptidyl-prolyl cis-trans isomerase
VSHRWKLFALCSSLTLLTAVAGCGRGGDSSPTAAIDGQARTAATPAGDSGQASARNRSDSKHPVVLMETSLGNITLRLDADKAPLTVDNFLSYVKAGHYDQTLVHQVYKGQGFLAGGYGINHAEKPARTPVRNEADNGVKNQRGAIAMVRLPNAIDSATCQFFVNVSDNPALDHRDRTPEGYGYCVFGQVIEGMDVVDKIGNVAVSDTKDFERTPTQAVVVKSMRQIR